MILPLGDNYQNKKPQQINQTPHTPDAPETSFEASDGVHHPYLQPI